MISPPVRAISFSMALALSTFSTISAYAETQNDHTAQDEHPDDDNVSGAVVGGIVLGLLGAAITSQAHDNGDDYHNHPGVSGKENLVGRCMHRTKKAMSNRGYHDVKFVKTLSHKEHKDGVHVINLEAVRTSDSHHQHSDNHHQHKSHIKVHCEIKHDKVVGFSTSEY